jgi:hypothetical protein
MRRSSARGRSQQHCCTARARGYITRAESTEESVDYKEEDAMLRRYKEDNASLSPALLRASFLMMGITILGTGARTIRDVRPLHMNDTRSGQVMGDPTRDTNRMDTRSLEERLITLIPRVGGLFQLFSSPHLFRPINEAIRHLGKRETTGWAWTRPEGINRPRAKRFAPVLTTEWNKIHSGTCETDKACSVISVCTDDNTCFPQGRGGSSWDISPWSYSFAQALEHASASRAEGSWGVRTHSCSRPLINKTQQDKKKAMKR